MALEEIWKKMFSVHWIFLRRRKFIQSIAQEKSEGTSFRHSSKSCPQLFDFKWNSVCYSSSDDISRKCIDLVWNSLQFLEHHLHGVVSSIRRKFFPGKWTIRICQDWQPIDGFYGNDILVGICCLEFCCFGAASWFSFAEMYINEACIELFLLWMYSDVRCCIWSRIFETMAIVE